MSGIRAHVRRGLAFLASVTLVATTVMISPGVAGALDGTLPEGQDFLVSPGDLDFILRQIEISEAHAERVVTEDSNASPLCSAQAVFDSGLYEQIWREPDGRPCVGSPLLSHGLRTVDGRWNNLHPGQDGYGAARELFPQLLGPEFRPADPVPEGPGAPTVPGQPTNPTTYDQTFGFVYDAEPRIISNLIVDQTTNNPAVVAKLVQFLEDDLDAHVLYPNDHPDEALRATQVDLDEFFEEHGIEEWTADDIVELMDGFPIFIQNVATDEGLSAPFSSWMTFFGQFFDHGLDLVEKGDNGTVVVPLHEDDVLYNPESNANFLMLTRATRHGNGSQHINRTTPFIDQNQTYTSHASHQVFLREYEASDGPGSAPVPTGSLLDNVYTVSGVEQRTLATWADVKDHAATLLGIELHDLDVHDVPLVVTDPYGRFVPGPERGLPQLVYVDPVDDDLGIAVEGDLDSPVPTRDASGNPLVHSAGQAFLDDIAHGADPAVAGYDAVLLDSHYITGDGRGNENIGLTAAHHIFHAEHNRLIGQIEAVIAYDSSPAVVDSGESRGLAAGYHADGFWDYPERLFQAARFLNEMQYQHLAVEEFLRGVAPNMTENPLNESAYHSDLNAAITAEFAHVVYRFGHSMLTESLPRIYPDGEEEELTLLEGFLNPAEFTKGGTLTTAEAAGSLVLGLADQVGNGIDEFVTETLRNELLGLPLDLATINIARARDTGIPRLQAARQQFYAATFDPLLKPYEHWLDFELNLKHSDSIVNFIAAYGRGDSAIDLPGTTPLDGPDGLRANDPGNLDERRARAGALVDVSSYMQLPPDQSGLDDVDLWVGGLAERTMVFGGMLGSTFNYVFELQANLLQNADRFYYLTRNQGQNFFATLEQNSFAELIMRHVGHMPTSFDIFTRPDHVIYVDDPDSWPEEAISWQGGVRYTGEDHVIMYGTDEADFMWGGLGDDTIWGGDGDDTIEGDDGDDILIGGGGDDVITDLNGEDTIIGGAGNDRILAGMGPDLVLGGSGHDFAMLIASDLNDMFGGSGNDIIIGGTGSDRIWGGDGDDWIEGGSGHDLIQGDNAIVFQNDPHGGHDVLIGGPGNNDLDSDGGDDIMVGGPGTDRFEGMLGFDWVTYKDHLQPVNADMNFLGIMPPDIAGIRDRYDLVEGLSGWNGDDILRGVSNIDDLYPSLTESPNGHELTEAHLDRVIGLRDLLQPTIPDVPAQLSDFACRFMVEPPTGCAIERSQSRGISNVLLGGAGSDIIEGRGGDDFIDGDVWLDVYLEWVDPDNADNVQRADRAGEFAADFLDRTKSPADVRIVREIVTPPSGDTESDIDTAVYNGHLDDYEITYLGLGYWEVRDLRDEGGTDDDPGNAGERPGRGDGADILRNIEVLEFRGGGGSVLLLADGEQGVGAPAGSISLDGDTPAENQPITATLTLADDVVMTGDVSWEWQISTGDDDWAPVSSASDDDGLTSTFTPGNPEVGRHLRAVAVFTDAALGVPGVRRDVVSDPTGEPVANVNDAPVAPQVQPNQPVVGAGVEAVGLEDPDGVPDDGVTYIWERLVDGDWQLLGTTNTATFQVPPAADGFPIRVTAEYTDNHGTPESISSEPTLPVIAPPNSPPEGEAGFAGQPQEGESFWVDTDTISDPDGPATLEFEYQWQRSEDGGTSWTDIGDLPAVEIEFGWAGQLLRVTVSYVDAYGFAESVTSDDVVILAAPVPLPTAPTGLSGAVTSGGVHVTWNASTDPGVTGYRLYRSSGTTPVEPVSGFELAAVSASATGYTDGTAAPGSTYHYIVVALKDDLASVPSNVATVVTPAAPITPAPAIPAPTTPDPIVVSSPPGATAATAPMSPSRYWDTRDGGTTVDGQYGGTGRLAADTSYRVQIAGRGGVPADAVGVIANITVIEPDAAGHATLYPCGDEVPWASHLNYGSGETVANNAIVSLSGDGSLCVYASAGAGFVLDVNGYVGADSPIGVVVPARYLDTRDHDSAGRVPADQAVQVQVAGRGAVPADADAVFVNITVIDAAADGYVTVWSGGPRPTASTVNFSAGDIVPNGAFVELSEDGSLWIYTDAEADILLDVTSYVLTGADGIGVMEPARLHDTRAGAPIVDGVGTGSPLAAHDRVEIQVTGRAGVPGGARAAFLNVAALRPDEAGYVTLFPCGATVPYASNLNFAGGDLRANNATTELTSDGKVCVYTTSATDLIVDVTGWIE